MNRGASKRRTDDKGGVRGVLFAAAASLQPKPFTIEQFLWDQTPTVKSQSITAVAPVPAAWEWEQLKEPQPILDVLDVHHKTPVELFPDVPTVPVTRDWSKQSPRSLAISAFPLCIHSGQDKDDFKNFRETLGVKYLGRKVNELEIIKDIVDYVVESDLQDVSVWIKDVAILGLAIKALITKIRLDIDASAKDREETEVAEVKRWMLEQMEKKTKEIECLTKFVESIADKIDQVRRKESEFERMLSEQEPFIIKGFRYFGKEEKESLACSNCFNSLRLQKMVDESYCRLSSPVEIEKRFLSLSELPVDNLLEDAFRLRCIEFFENIDYGIKLREHMNEAQRKQNGSKIENVNKLRKELKELQEDIDEAQRAEDLASVDRLVQLVQLGDERIKLREAEVVQLKDLRRKGHEAKKSYIASYGNFVQKLCNLCCANHKNFCWAFLVRCCKNVDEFHYCAKKLSKFEERIQKYINLSYWFNIKTGKCSKRWHVGNDWFKSGDSSKLKKIASVMKSCLNASAYSIVKAWPIDPFGNRQLG